MFSDTKVQVAAASARCSEITRFFEVRTSLRRCSEVDRASQHPWDVFGQHVQHLAGGIPTGNSLCIRREDREVLVPTIRKLAMLHSVEVVGQFGKLPLVLLKLRRP